VITEAVAAILAVGVAKRVDQAIDLLKEHRAPRRGAHWGNPKTLARHFRDHGADFGAKNADDYARQASDFLRSSQAGGLPTKIDADGVIRVFDPKSNTFGAFNPDGTTRTFFKPSSPTYWDRQPGSAPWTPK
jgi:pyocin large subunit-like protein